MGNILARPVSRLSLDDETPAPNEPSQSTLQDEIQAIITQLAEIDKRYHFYEKRPPLGTRSDDITATVAFWDELLRQYNYLKRQRGHPPEWAASANKEEETKIQIANNRRLGIKPSQGISTVAGPSSMYELRTRPQCCVCYDRFPQHKIVHLKCSDLYCTGCLKGLFLRATKDRSLFPPKCCREVIPLHLIQSHLSLVQQRAFKNAAVEFNTPNAKYCSNKTCRRVFPPSRIKAGAEIVKCKSCGRSTCIICQKPTHKNGCPKDEALQATLSLSMKQGWRRCFSCQNMVERSAGCYHIICRCKAEFCYRCGKKWTGPCCPYAGD